ASAPGGPELPPCDQPDRSVSKRKESAMMTREIPHDQWMPFLNDFSKRHQGECVTIEVLEGQDGIHALASNVPLVGVTDDPKNSEGEMIEIMAGDSPDAQMTHDI